MWFLLRLFKKTIKFAEEDKEEAKSIDYQPQVYSARNVNNSPLRGLTSTKNDKLGYKMQRPIPQNLLGSPLHQVKVRILYCLLLKFR